MVWILFLIWLDYMGHCSRFSFLRWSYFPLLWYHQATEIEMPYFHRASWTSDKLYIFCWWFVTHHFSDHDWNYDKWMYIWFHIDSLRTTPTTSYYFSSLELLQQSFLSARSDRIVRKYWLPLQRASWWIKLVFIQSKLRKLKLFSNSEDIVRANLLPGGRANKFRK